MPFLVSEVFNCELQKVNDLFFRARDGSFAKANKKAESEEDESED